MNGRDPFTDVSGEALANRLEAAGLGHWNPAVPERVAAAIAPGRHGDLDTWRGLLAQLEALPQAALEPGGPAVATAAEAPLPPGQRAILEQVLMGLHPWRKGPFSLHGIDIDAEWRSDLKWARVTAAGIDLRATRILDVGCGNAWYAWRMIAAGARTVIGVDPTLKHGMQAWAVRRCLLPPAPEILPLPLEALPPGRGDFDRVFSMGVLYHRKSPIDHLAALREHLAPGGMLLLESLVIAGGIDQCLCPPDRYARMRNVWFIPSTPLLARWLERSGYDAVEVLDESVTTVDEQRSTPWMRFESLPGALDPVDPMRTVENHPAPRRALLAARRRD